MTARGIRNNNAGNLRHGSKWDGLRSEQTDPDFCQFVSMAYGCRALIKTLITYHCRYGLSTVAGIIRRWAPPNENDTAAYSRAVAAGIGRPEHQRLDFEDDPVLYVDIARMIARHENGKDAALITSDDWEEGARLAGLILS